MTAKITNNKAVANSLIFQAGIGNIGYINQLIGIQTKALSDEQQTAITSTITGLAPAGTLSREQRPILQESVKQILNVERASLEGSLPSLYKIEELMPTVLGFLNGQEIAKMARTNTLFQILGPVAITDRLKSETKYKVRNLVCYKMALHLSSMKNLLELFPPTSSLITDLDLSNSRMTQYKLASIIPFVPKLKSLNLDLSRELTDNAIARVALLCPDLEIISLSWCVGLTNAAILSLIQNCPRIKDINLSFCSNITDAAIIALTNRCQDLQSIDIMGCRLITDSSLREIAQNCPGLKKISLKNCELLTDAAVIRFAQDCPNIRCIDFFEHDFNIKATLLAEMAKKCPHVTFNLDEDLEAKIIQYRRELAYKPSTAEGMLYSALLNQADTQEIEALLKRIDKQLLKEIYYQLPILKWGFEIANWGELHILDKDVRNDLFCAVQQCLRERLKKLPEEKKVELSSNLVLLADTLSIMLNSGDVAEAHQAVAAAKIR